MPDELPFGATFSSPSGLKLSVLALNLQRGMDGNGNAYRFAWVDGDTYPNVLPGFARLGPGETLRGRAFVPFSELAPRHPGTLRAAFLAFGDGCGTCGGVQFFPLALWQATAIPPDWLDAEYEAQLTRDGTG